MRDVTPNSHALRRSQGQVDRSGCLEFIVRLDTSWIVNLNAADTGGTSNCQPERRLNVLSATTPPADRCTHGARERWARWEPYSLTNSAAGLSVDHAPKAW